MEYVYRDGVAISRVGFGCAPIAGRDYGPVSDDVGERVIRRALDSGITLFDTADVYGLGHAESLLSAALGSKRHDVVIATKVGVRWNAREGASWRDLQPAYLEQALGRSLKRLNVDCITLYQVHWPDAATPVEETFGALARFREQGKIRWIGCCNVNGAYVTQARRVCTVDAYQGPFNLLQREHEATFALCRDRYGMLAMTYNALGQGLFTGKYDANARFSGTDIRMRSALFEGEMHRRGLAFVERLHDVARRRRRSLAQVALRWVLQQPSVDMALAGMKSTEQVDDNAGAAGWHLHDRDLAFLSDTDALPTPPNFLTSP